MIQKAEISILKQTIQRSPIGSQPFKLHGYDFPQFPLYFIKKQMPSWDQQWFSKFKKLPYQKSHFGISSGNQELRIYNDHIRLSEYCRTAIPQFNQLFINGLSEWSGNPKQDFDDSSEWNCLRYVNGHFSWHQDKVRFKEGFSHYGTLLMMPPMSYQRFENGELKIISLEEKELSFIPDQNKWTYIILPLGYRHCVEKVSGTRHSFSKELFVKNGVELKNHLKPKSESKKDDQMIR